MKNTKLTRKANTVTATYLPYAAYKNALALATTHKGEIGQTDKGNFKATFDSVATAKKFITEWTADYNAHKSTPTPTKPTATKGKTPRKSKGNAIDFTQFKGTKSENNKALHKMLVSMGHADSRTKEYQAVWNARPWAN
jgi:hypothetical protein